MEKNTQCKSSTSSAAPNRRAGQPTRSERGRPQSATTGAATSAAENPNTAPVVPAMSMEQLLQLLTQTPEDRTAFAAFAQQLIPVPKPQQTQPDSLPSPPVPPQDEQTNKEGEEEGRLIEALEDLEEEEVDFGEDSISQKDVEGDVSEEDDVDLATETGVVEEASFEHMVNRSAEDGEVTVAAPVQEPSIGQPVEEAVTDENVSCAEIRTEDTAGGIAMDDRVLEEEPVQVAPEPLEEVLQVGTDTRSEVMDSDNLAMIEGDKFVIPEDVETELGGNDVVIGKKDSEVPKENQVEDEQPAEAATKQIVSIPDNEEKVSPFQGRHSIGRTHNNAVRRWPDPNTRLHRG